MLVLMAQPPSLWRFHEVSLRGGSVISVSGSPLSASIAATATAFSCLARSASIPRTRSEVFKVGPFSSSALATMSESPEPSNWGPWSNTAPAMFPDASESPAKHRIQNPRLGYGNFLDRSGEESRSRPKHRHSRMNFAQNDTLSLRENSVGAKVVDGAGGATLK